MSPRRRLLPFASIPAGLLGAAVMAQHGEARVVLHLAFLAIALVIGVASTALDRQHLRRIAPWGACVALALMCSTLLGEGMSGVHRWIVVGPIRLHVSSLIASPLALVGACALASNGGRWRSLGLLIATQIVHGLQPDAGQATAVAIGAIAALARVESNARDRLVGSALLSATAAPTWWIADPLPAVPSVEGIVALARDLGVVVHSLAFVTLALPPTAMVFAARDAFPADDFTRTTTAALTAYVAAAIVVPAFGHFPVPTMGFGVSPMIGVAVSLGIVALLTARE